MVPDNREAPSKAIGKDAKKGTKDGKRGKSNAPNGSQILLATTTMTSKRMAPTRSMSWPPSTISSTRHDSQMSTLRNFSKWPI
jgi:hypothetical protein